MKTIKFPKTFKFGSATAATQIEGGDLNSNWYHWSLKGKIAGGESSIIAADHYNRYLEDIELMKTMNHEIYRMSIEWSRIEPEKGKWSEEGILHYQEELRVLKDSGIEVMLTLHHFSHPQWFEEEGQWTNPKSVAYFLKFTEKIIETMGHLVHDYCTINEPNVFANDTFMDGKYPPGKKDDIKSYFKAGKHLILAHLKAYKLIHNKRLAMGFQDSQVGMAIHLAYFDVKGYNPLTHLSKNLYNHAFHQIFLKGMIEGKLTWPLGRSYPMGKGFFSDYIGVNYYSRHLIHSSMNPALLFGRVEVEENLAEDQVNDLGWEIYPQGLYECVKNVFTQYKLPIYITENGIPDSNDTKRAKFIYNHLLMVRELLDHGVDVRKYYHWSLLDNLEWNEGYGPRFGLVEVDYRTQKRTIRRSGYFYALIAKNKTITKDMVDEYLK